MELWVKREPLNPSITPPESQIPLMGTNVLQADYLNNVGKGPNTIFLFIASQKIPVFFLAKEIDFDLLDVHPPRVLFSGLLADEFD